MNGRFATSSRMQRPSVREPNTIGDEIKHIRRQVDSKLTDFDVKGAVKKIVWDDTLAGFSETHNALLEKHPNLPVHFVTAPVKIESGALCVTVQSSKSRT